MVDRRRGVKGDFRFRVEYWMWRVVCFEMGKILREVGLMEIMGRK